MKLAPGDNLDGFVVDECLHTGGMAHIYAVHYANASQTGFNLAMKVPQMGRGDGGENIVSYEVEQQIMAKLKGPYVPRYVAAGDLQRVPYLVMEHIEGRAFSSFLSERKNYSIQDLAQFGAAIAKALHSLHQQEVVHQDVKPGNVLIRPDGSAVMLDFGLSYHAHLPDLMADQSRKPVGTPPYMAPEQVVGVRGDPRSDLFALGAMLYEMATGVLPFGPSLTDGGLRQRLWMDPIPLRQRQPDIPMWFQEIVLRCLETEADNRYPSGAHLALELSHPEQVKITARGQRVEGTPFLTHFKRWIKAAGKHYHPSPLPTEQIAQVPIVMVALPHWDVSDATFYALRQAVKRSLGLRPGACLAVVSVISNKLDDGLDADNEPLVQRHLLSKMRQWAAPLDMDLHHTSFHLLSGSDVADTLLLYAQNHHIDLIVMGAATHGLTRQSLNLSTTIPIKVAMLAPCSVLLVKQDVPFSHLGDS